MIDAATAASANLVTWPAGRPLARCHGATRSATACNPTTARGRFRPIYDRRRRRRHVVPTAYGAEDALIAFAEHVLRNVAAHHGAAALLPANAVKDKALASLAYEHDLLLVELRGYGLRRLGLRRSDCIDTGPEAYLATARLAQALYDAQPRAQGLVWTSQQTDHGAAVVLWETRLDLDRLTEHGQPLELDSQLGNTFARAACERAGVLFET